MAVAPLIAMKGNQVKSFAAVAKELDRRAHTYVNDVDGTGRHIGFKVRKEDEHPLSLEKSIDRRLGELKLKRKLRDNQVRAMGFVVSSNDFLSEENAKKFLKETVNWFAVRYGIKNLLAANIHLDEGTPHVHVWIAPVIHDKETGYDRLCAKELFAPDKRRKNAEGKWEVVAQGTMSRLQEDFYEQVAKKWGYERPLRREQRAEGYRSLEAYKVHVGTSRELQTELEQLKTNTLEKRGELGTIADAVKEKTALSAEIDNQIAEKKAQIKNLDEKINEKAERLEYLRQAESGEARLSENLDKLIGTIEKIKGKILGSNLVNEAVNFINRITKSIDKEVGKLQTTIKKNSIPYIERKTQSLAEKQAFVERSYRQLEHEKGNRTPNKRSDIVI